MQISPFLLILFSAIAALAIAFFQYYYNSRHTYQYVWLFIFLRFTTIFLVLVLLVNPTIKNTEYYIEKPNLVLAVDNSASIEHLGATKEVKGFVEEITTNSTLKKQFNIEVFTFGKELNKTNTLDFSETQTNIQGSLKSLEELYKNAISPTILISDGNQTFGEDYYKTGSYSNSIFPVVAGDTTSIKDLSLSRINVNKYAFLDNNFPVELMINYSGNEPVSSKLEIRSGKSIIHSEEISFTKSENSKIIEATLPASKIGVNIFEAEITPLAEEKNLLNNKKNFAVEVIDERTTILLISDIIHPDLGAIKKAIESNRQREVDIHQLKGAVPDLNNYQLVILYQPTKNFKNIFEDLQQENKNYWIITGPETDWNYLNNNQDHFQKHSIVQTEAYFPYLNKDYTSFQMTELNFKNFPPLEGAFGKLKTNDPLEILLFQQAQGINTKDPLLATLDQGNSKAAFLFGANIWKWRAHVFLENRSFEKFDEFFGQLIQFTASKERKERVSLSYEAFYYGNEKVIIQVHFFDRNFQFDPRAELHLELIDEKTQEKQTMPFLLEGNVFEVILDDLPASEYFFDVKIAGENITKSGKFSIVEYHVEQQFNTANFKGLEKISGSSNQEVFFLKESEEIVNEIMSENSYIPLQKSRKNNVPLINWYYLLGVIVFSLSTEWFLRKYYGYI